MNYVLLIPPILGAVIGYVTNVIAVELLFHPKKPIKIFGFKIQGLVPARSRELTERFLDTLSEVLTKEDFEMVIGNALDRTVSENEVIFKIEKAFESIKDTAIVGRLFDNLSKYFSDAFKEFVREAIVKNIASNVDIKEFVIKKAEEISDEEIERLFKKFAKKELRFIELSGAVLGFVIGIFQSVFMYFMMH